jgi:hypothetical protein
VLASCDLPRGGPSINSADVTTPFEVFPWHIIVQFSLLVPNSNRLLGIIPFIAPAVTPMPVDLVVIENGGNKALSDLPNANLLFGDL